MTRITHFRLVLALVMGGVAGCSLERSVGTRSSDSLPKVASVSGGPSLIECPASGETRKTSALIGPLGGVLAVGNTRVMIPADAVLFPTSFTLTVPASRYAEIEVTAGNSEHYLFALPVVVTIDYGSCGRTDLGNTALSVWNIDPPTKELLEQMVGVDDKATQTVTFTTIHFSGYAVAD